MPVFNIYMAGGRVSSRAAAVTVIAYAAVLTQTECSTDTESVKILGLVQSVCVKKKKKKKKKKKYGLALFSGPNTDLMIQFEI